MTARAGINAGFKVTENGNVLFGREFPDHLQVAFGRHIARLLCAEDVNAVRCKVWLRDLPLSVLDLDSMGYASVLPAYRDEEKHLCALNGGGYDLEGYKLNARGWRVCHTCGSTDCPTLDDSLPGPRFCPDASLGGD